MTKVLLIGNGNCGKTTLFNALTGASEKTGNWFGVTVGGVTKNAKIGGKNYAFTDLPGVVSFQATSLEENCVITELNGGDYDVILNVLDVNNLEMGLKITQTLLRYNKPIVLFVNFYKDFVKRGGYLNEKAFLSLTGLTVVFGDAISKNSIEKLKDALQKPHSKIFDFNVSNVLKQCYRPLKVTLSKFDELLFDIRFGTAFYCAVLFFAFYLAFGNYGLGRIMSNCLEALFVPLNAKISDILSAVNVNSFLNRLLVEGLLSGVEGVLVFIPQIAVLNAILILLEQSGIIARISFIYNDLFTKLGLNGKAIFALISGFGCTAIALNLTNGLDNEKMKKRVCLALPNVICSAKVPVFLYFANRICGAQTSFILPLCYVFSVLALSVALKILGLKQKKPSPMVLEVPRLLKLNAKSVLKPLINNLKEFIIKITTIVTLVSIATFLLLNLGCDFKPIADIQQSLLYFLASKLKFIFKPIGIDSWELTASLIFGLFAKESIVSTLNVLNFRAPLNFARILAISMFIIFYTPCFAALAQLKCQVGAKYMLISAFVQFFIGLIACYVMYLLLSNILFFNVFLLALTAVIFVRLILKYERNHRTKNRKNTKAFDP